MRSLIPCVLLVGLFVAAAGCDETPASKDNNSAASASPEATKPVPKTEPPKPSGPPQLSLDSASAKVGYEQVPLDKPDGRDRLDKALADAKSFLDGKTASLLIDRNAKLAQVIIYFQALEKIGVTGIEVKTESRQEFPTSIVFTPATKLDGPKPCSVVAMVMEDRSTAVWRLVGGTATKHRKGFAGPDLTTTGDTLEHMAKGCPDSTAIFVSSAPIIEWGLTYDLAASSRKLEKAKFDTAVLLEKEPTAGRKVDL